MSKKQLWINQQKFFDWCSTPMQWSADDATMENQSLACCWKLVHSQIKWFKFDTLLCIFWWRSGPRNNRRVAKQSVPSCIDFSFSLCYVHSLTAEVTTEATWLLPVRRSLEQEGTRNKEDKRMNFDTWKSLLLSNHYGYAKVTKNSSE